MNNIKLMKRFNCKYHLSSIEQDFILTKFLIFTYIVFLKFNSLDEWHNIAKMFFCFKNSIDRNQKWVISFFHDSLFKVFIFFIVFWFFLNLHSILNVIFLTFYLENFAKRSFSKNFNDIVILSTFFFVCCLV